jgi:hypothetical protein
MIKNREQSDDAFIRGLLNNPQFADRIDDFINAPEQFVHDPYVDAEWTAPVIRNTTYRTK